METLLVQKLKKNTTRTDLLSILKVNQLLELIILLGLITHAQKELQLFRYPRGKYYAALFGYGGPNVTLKYKLLEMQCSWFGQISPYSKKSRYRSYLSCKFNRCARPAGCLWLNPFSNAIEHMPIKIITETTILSMPMIKLVLL